MNKIALIIGNRDYVIKPLKNPINDVEKMAEALKEIGFEISLNVNQTTALMEDTIDSFCGVLEPYDVVLLYYAGHAIQVNGFNYLIPIDADIKEPKQVDRDCVRVDKFINNMHYYTKPKTCIVILDACRTNPFKNSIYRDCITEGLAPMKAPTGTFIAFSTSPDEKASDGEGDNGRYTKYFLKHIMVPNIKIETLFKRIREDVENDSKSAQIPWESTSLVKDFYFIKNDAYRYVSDDFQLASGKKLRLFIKDEFCGDSFKCFYNIIFNNEITKELIMETSVFDDILNNKHLEFDVAFDITLYDGVNSNAFIGLLYSLCDAERLKIMNIEEIN